LAQQSFRSLGLKLRDHHPFLLVDRLLHAFSKFLDVVVDASAILISLCKELVNGLAPDNPSSIP
jgi:hypothetical protein